MDAPLRGIWAAGCFPRPGHAVPHPPLGHIALLSLALGTVPGIPVGPCPGIRRTGSAPRRASGSGGRASPVGGPSRAGHGGRGPPRPGRVVRHSQFPAPGPLVFAVPADQQGGGGPPDVPRIATPAPRGQLRPARAPRATTRKSISASPNSARNSSSLSSTRNASPALRALLGARDAKYDELAQIVRDGNQRRAAGTVSTGRNRRRAQRPSPGPWPTSMPRPAGSTPA